MSTNAIKLLALICMLIDHLGEFLIGTPVWFRYIGRLSAPLFFFCSAWGFHYTRNREKYLLRLYVLGVFMSVGNIIILRYVGKGLSISNNIFVTLFLGCFIVFLYEKTTTIKEKIRYLILFILQQVIAFGGCALLAEILNIPRNIDTYSLYYGYGALFGSMIFTEGSILFVLFFVMVYFLKDKPGFLCGFVVLFSGVLGKLINCTYYMRGWISYLIPFARYQWIMVAVIPFFFLYNGKKGKNWKWFYYVFYPLHLWGIYFISSYV